MKFLTLLALFAATPALADCPTNADLATGIRAREGDGTVHIFRDLGDGVVQQTSTYTDGYTFRTLLAQGAHVLQLADLENGKVIADSISSTRYDVDPSDLPVPQPMLSWEADTTVQGFGETYVERQLQSWGAAAPMTIGDCTLTALPGKIRYVSEDGTVQEALIYFPDVGISLLMSYLAPADDIQIYTYVEIEPVQ